MKILFRTSGGRIQKKELGLGHIHRCINLSKEISSHDLTFLIEDFGSVSSLLKEQSLKYIKLKPGLSENADIKNTIKTIQDKKIDLVIVDRYGLTNKYAKAIKKETKLVIISDLRNIEYNADLLVNGFIGYKNKIIFNKHGTKCLLGPKYQILNPIYTKKKLTIKKKIDILATFGGFDSANIIPVLIKSLKNNMNDFRIKIILGQSTKKNSELTKLITKYKKYISIIQKVPNMRKEISEAKFGFCAGGMTTYEFAYMKVPFAIICQYPHQLITSKEWEKLGIGLNLGKLSNSTPKKIQNIANNLEKYKNILKINHNIVDGLGTKRIRKEITSLK
jgi:UDP-2,4-diacetamido-2,4,6-trideoxy-beta-L-altropyranose hydrolase